MKYIFKAMILSFMLCSTLFAGIDDHNIASWNMQGSSANTEAKWSVNVRQLITGSNPADILLIQEAGSLPLSAVQTSRQVQHGGIPVHEYIWNLGTTSRPNNFYIYYSRVDVGANRVNLAIVSRTQADDVLVLAPPSTLSRPLLGIRLGQDVFFSIHALASGGSDAPAIVQSIHNHFISQPNINWLIGGDFNREPDSLYNALESGVRSRVNIVATDTPTQASGRTLDYVLTGNSGTGSITVPLLAATLMLANMRSQISSDHTPVNFRRF